MALLEVEGLTVRLGGHLAVDGATVSVEAGGITGLIGPNGAGKTSLFDAVCGLQPQQAGSIRLDGDELSRLAPHERARRGMARTFQRLETFTHLTVRENILAGGEFRRRWVDDEDVELPERIDELVDRLGLGDVADERVDSLPTGRARLVEVGRALASRPKLLLLDEPSSGLDQGETGALAALLRELSGDGLGILMVEHDMSLVMGTCDVIYVLELGKIIASGTPVEVQADPVVRRAYLGGSQDGEGADEPSRAERVRPRWGPDGVDDNRAGDGRAPLLELSGICAGHGGIDVVSDVSFEVSDGEVFALLGPNGSGKTTTLDVIAGLLVPSRGRVAFCGRDVGGATADGLARAGLRMVPEGRGIFPNLSVAENLWMSTFTGVDRATVEERTYARFPRLSQRRRQTAGTLSGGEQQMLAMARALSTDPAMLVLDELSMGLAPLVVADLYSCVAELADEGIAVLVVEQFAHEVLGVADRAAIMLNGRIERIGDPAAIAEELGSAYLSGVARR